MPSNVIKGFYLEEAWKNAFTGNNSSIIFDVDGNVFKDSISFANLVNDKDGNFGLAGRPTDGQITIWINAPSSSATTGGLVHTVIEELNTTHQLQGGAITTGEWVHFNIKLDSVNKKLELKINDVVVETLTLSADLNLFSQLQGAVLFRYLDKTVENVDRYDGMVDDFRIYSKALTDQDDTDIFLWGNQSLQFQKKVFVPKQAFARGCTVGFKFESDDFMQIRTMGIKYNNKQIR